MAAYNEESVQWLYDKLQDGYDTGSIDEFKEDLKDDETRKWYHNEATKMGLNVGDEDTFRSLVVPEEVEPEQRTGTVVDQTIDDINRATGHMPQDVQDMAFSGQQSMNGQTLAEKNNPQMFQKPAVDPEPWKAEGLTKEQYEDIAWTRAVNRSTPLAVDEEGQVWSNAEVASGNREQKTERTYQTKESWGDEYSRKASRYGELRYGWRRGQRFRQLDNDGNHLAGYVAQTDPEAAASAEQMSDQQLIEVYNKLSKQINKGYAGGIWGYSKTPEGQQLGAQLNAIGKELHFRDLGYEHTSSVNGRGEVDYRSIMTEPDVAQEANRLVGTENRDAEVARLYQEGVTSGNMEAAERAMLASAALYCKERDIDIDKAYAMVEADAFNTAMRAPLQADVDKIYNEEKSVQQAKMDEVASKYHPTGDPQTDNALGMSSVIEQRLAAPTRDMLNTMARRAVNESAAARAYYGLMLREHMRGGTMDIIHARAAAMNDVRNLFRDREVARVTPDSNWGIILGSGLSENLPMQAIRGLTNLATGDYESDMIYDEGMARAKANAGVMTNVLAGVAPFVADSALGAFKIPGLVGKAASTGAAKLATWSLNRVFGLGEEVAMRRLGGSWVYRIVSGGLSGSANFGTYMGMSAAVSGFRQGNFSWGDTWEGAKHGAFDGLIFGGTNGTMSKIIESAKGGWAIAAETGALVTEAGVFTALDYMRTGEITAESVGQSLGMVLASRAMNFKGWTSDVAARVNGTKWQHQVKGPVRWSQETRDELQDRYPTLCRLMGGDNLAKDLVQGSTGKANRKTGNLKEVDAVQTANAIEHEWEQMQNDPTVDFAAKRMANYVLNGQIVPTPAVCNWRVGEVDDNGVSYGETLDINGNVIERFKLTNDKERSDFEQGVALDAERNRLGIEEASWRAREVDPVIANAIDAVASANGIDPNELAKAYFSNDSEIKGKAMRSAVKDAESLVMDEMRTKTNHRAAVEDKYDIDLEEVIKTPARDRSENEQNALDEYEMRLTDRYDESQDKSTAELVAEDMEQSRNDGFEAQGDERADIKERLEDAANALTEMRIDPRQFDSMDENAVSDWLESRGNNAEETEAVLEYLDARSAFEGIRDRVQDEAGKRIEEAAKETDDRTNNDTGMIHPVVMGDDREAFVVSGRVEVKADGTIDLEKSDRDIVVRYPDEEQPVMTTADKIKSGEPTIDPEAAKQETADGIMQEVAGEAVSQMNRDLAFNEGDTFTVLVDGKPVELTVVGTDPNTGNPILQDSAGRRAPAYPDIVQQMHDEWREWVKNGGQDAVDNGERRMDNEGAPTPEAPRGNAAPVEERPAEEQAAGPAIMPAPGITEPKEMLDYFRASGMSDRVADRTITNNIVAANERLNKAERELNESKETDPQKLAELDRAMEEAQRDLDYWNAVARLKNGGGETAAQQRPTEQAGAPVAENEMQPVEEPTAEIGGTAEEYQGDGMSDEMRERMDDGTGIVGIVDNIARQLGLKVRDWDGPENIPGYIDPDNGVIYINRNRVEGTRDTYRFTLGHELTHGLKKLAEDLGRPELYEALRGAALSAVRVREGSGYDKFVSDMMNRYRNAHYMDAYDKAIAAGTSKAEAIEAGRAEADRVTQDFIEEEIVCDTVGELLSGDESRARELLEQVEDKSVMQRIKDYFTELLTKVRDAFGKGSKEYDDLDNVINRFNEMYNEVLKQREEMGTSFGYTESGVDNATDRTSDRLSVSANFEGMGFKFWDDHLDADGKKQAMEDKDGNFYVMLGDRRFDYKNHITAEDLAETDSALNFMLGDAVKTADNPDGRISPITAYRIRSNYAKLLNLFLDLGSAEKGGASNLEDNYQMVAETVFRCVSTNGDKQYGVSLDITRICKKNEAVINTISELQRRQGYGATPAQILDIYLTTHNEGYQVPCPVCYVFSRYIRNGKFASAAIAGMEMYGEHLPGGSGKEWTVQQWMDELKKLGGLKDDTDAEDGGEKNEGSKMFKDMSKAANDAITRNLTLIDNAGMRIAREMNKENPDEAVIRQCEEDIRRLAEEYRKATDVFNAMSQTNWIKNFAIRKTKAGWVMWEDARMPEDMEDFKTHALDLRLTADTIENYPAIQRLRRSGGSASGKEIHQASNNEIGEAVMGLGQKGAPQYRNYYKEAMETADPIERENLLKTAREKYRKAAEFAAKQNLRGGQRMWSWSDNIERLSPDVISNLMQMEILGAGLQSYSKQLEGVEMVARMNGYVNGSLMGKDNGYREVDESKFDKDTMRLTDDLKDTIFDTRLKENRDQIVASKGAMVHEVDGKYYVLIYDDVLGIDAHGGVGKDGKQKLGLFDLNNQYDRAGNILVTMNDMHSKLALADDRVHFIIPWHSSGANQHILAQMFSMLGQDVSVRSTDYTSMQEEKDMGNAKNDIPKHLHEVWDKARQHAEERGWTIGIGEIDSTGAKLTESQKEYRRLRDAIMDGTVKADPKNKDYQAIMADEFLRQAYETIQEKAGGKMTADDKKYIYPYEYWDKSSTLATADENGWRYMEYCRRLGRRPKFSGKYDGDSWSDKGDFTESKGYWKTLIDRRMYGNGETPEQCRYQDMTPIDSSNFDTDIVDRNAVREKFNPTQVAEEEGVTRIVDIVQDTERRRIGELRPNLGMGAKRAITAQNKAAAALKEVALTAKEKKAMAARAEGDKKFSLPETTVDESPDSDAGVRFSIVQDPGEIEMIERELARDKEETGEYEVRYRAMALIDNELHQPMASMEDGKLRDGLREGDIERSDEIDIDSYITPEIRQQMDALEKGNKKGDVEIIPGKLRYHKGSERGKCTMQFHLVKPDGTDLWAAYNPYLHMSNTPLNDQFSSAWRRPELVVVRVLIPRRELSSGYAAKYAKNVTGDADWKSGPVNGALPKDAQRKVTLSRYCKIAGIVPVDQAVDMYADKLLKNNVTVPFNTVTPAEREELYRRGVKIGAPEKGSGGDCMRAYIQWVGEHPDGPKGGKRFSVDSVVAEAEQMTETNPTDGQKESGNYKKGHVKVDGFDISIEQPKGSVRSGVDADGNEWSQEMHNTYGYIRGTEGVDGDHIDVFLSDHLDGWNGNVYVVDQVNKDRSFDEHKVMYGFNSEQEARDAYLSNYEEGWTGLGNITGVSREEFKKWVDSSHRKNKPFAEYKNVKPLQSTDETGARFSLKDDEERTLMGMHNITADKLRSALKLGGLANPSMAVINTEVGGFTNFGEISLIPSSDLIASRTGDNAGTWGADAYSPRFPETHRRLGKGGDKKMRSWVKGLKMRQEMEFNTEEQFNDYYNGFNIRDNALVYPFLHEKGLSGEVDYYTHMNVDQRLEDDLREVNGDQWALLKRFDEDNEYKKKLTDIVVGDEVGKIHKKEGESFQEFRDRRREWAKQIRDGLTGEDGYINRNLAEDLLYAQARAYRENGKFSESRTVSNAEQYIRDHGMEDEYKQYFDDKMKELGAETQVYAGSDSQGRSKYKPVSLDQVSRMMKKQGRAGGEGGIFEDSPGAIRAKLLTPMKTLDQIRKQKGRIVDQEQFEQAREDYQNELREYADAYARGSMGALADIITSSNMAATAKRYNIDLDADAVAELNKFKNRVRALPTEYFETKFERPVMLDEFKKAIVPDNLPLELQGALQRAGLEVVEYPAGDNAARERVTLDAVKNDSNILFSLSEEQREEQTHSENFKKWFGDWENDPDEASKVVDSDGRPKVVLHGTPNNEFYAFDPEKTGSNTDQGWLGKGFYFYGNAPEYASQYAGKNGRVLQVYLDIKNPYIASVEEFNRLAEANDPEMSRRFREQLEDEGYDGVYYNGDLNEEWVAFRPEQIKSATDNNGEFSRENPDIRFSLSEDTQKIFDTAKRKFGETKDIREAGYVLPDGTMLDFSGRHEMDPGSDSSHLAGSRHTDHRAINQIDFVYDENGDEVDTGVSSDMPDFIKRGAIRIDNNAGLINLSVKPTAEQRKVLRQLVAENGGTVDVDFGDGWDTEHHVEYNDAKATRVLGDIDRYFDEGIKPESNARFSLGEEIENYQPEQVSWERGMLDRLLQNAANNAERNDMRKQATREVNRTLRGLFDRLSAPGADAGNLGFDISRATQAAARAQRGYDRWTVDELVSMAKSMLKSGMYKELRPYEVQRLVNMINQGVGRREIQDQMNTVFDVLMKANLRGWSAQLKKLMSTKPYNINSQTGVRTIGQVDGLGGRILTAMRRGVEMTSKELSQRIEEVSNRLDNDDTASHELEGLMLAQQYNDMVGKYDADNKNIKDLIREQQEKVYDFYQVPVLDEDGNPKYHHRTGEQLFETRKRLKPEFGGLDAEGNRQPVSEENKALRQRVEATVAGLENSMRENWVRMSEGYDRITDDLGGNVAAAVTRAKEFRENEKLRKQQIYHAANSDLLGVEDNTETVDPSQQMSPANWSLVRGLLGPLATFEKMMRFFGRRNANGEGRLFNMFVRRQIDCGDREWRDKKAGMDEMDNKAKELFGKKWMTMGNEMRDGKKFPFITLSYFDKTGKPRTIDLRQDEAVYIYCVNKMRDGQMKLNAMGIDGDKVEQIVQRLDPRLVELADWYQGEFLPKHRNRYNETYERMFGTPMAHIDNYIHLNINKRETASNQELGEPVGDQRGPTYVTGSLKERKTNVTPIELRTSIFDLAWSEHDKMEHWNAWGEFSRDLKDLTNYRNFRAKLFNMKSVEFGNGKELLDNFKRCAAIVTGDYDNPGRHAKIDRAATNLAKGVTSAKIGFRAFTALKQTLSFPAFFSDARPDDLLFAIGNAEGTIKWAMENLPGFSKRWQSRQAGDTRLMETDSDWKVWKYKWVKKIGTASMLPNASVDCLTVAIGARGVYLTAKRRYLDYGFSEAQAEKRALQDAAISYNASQQSSEGAFTSAQQVDRTLAGVATTVFRNASMGYERRFTQGLRNLKNMAKRGYREEVIENTKKQMMEEGLTEEQAERAAERVYNRMKWHSMVDVVNFGFVLPFFWNLGPAMVYILGGEDDEQKQELVRDSALHALYGPIEGLSMGGTISELANIITGSMLMDEKSFKETMQGLRHRNFNPLPIVSDMQSVFNSFATDTWSGVNDVFNIVVQMGVGVNPETVTNMTWGIIDACQGDMDLARKTAFAFLRFINAPASQVDKLYMDELGITKDEASRMSWDELAKKYARYHAVKDATVIAPFLSDEAEAAREERYVDRFYDRAMEQLEKADDEDLQRVYDQGDEQKKMVAKETAKRAGLKEDRYGKKPDSDTKPETVKATEAYQSKRSYADMAEDVLLQKAKADAANAGDDDRADAIEKVLKSITKLRNGDSKKGVKGMGVDRETDERILEKIRETRSKALKELKITR